MGPQSSCSALGLSTQAGARGPGVEGRPGGPRLAATPAVPSPQAGEQVSGAPGLLRGEEGGGDGVPQAPGVGLQQHRGAGQELQGARGQRGRGAGTQRGQQRAAAGRQAQLPPVGALRGHPRALGRRLVEEEGDEAQDCVRCLQKGEKGRVNREPKGHRQSPATCKVQGPMGPPFPALTCKMGAEITLLPRVWGGPNPTEADTSSFVK